MQTKKKGYKANKNSQLHLSLETKLYKRLKEEAKVDSVGLAEHCRTKLREASKEARIEQKLDAIIERLVSH